VFCLLQTERPQAQYDELVAAFNERGALRLKNYDELFDRDAQDQLLGPFSRRDRLTIPFFVDKGHRQQA
jgi:hypothetical protein